MEHGGLADINQHTTKVKKHLLALSSTSKNDMVTSFFFKESS